MPDEVIADNLPFWVTRQRHESRPQLPHPDALDEWLDGKPTGRIQKIAPGGKKLIGTIEEIDAQLAEMPTQALVDGARLMRKLINKGTAHKKHEPPAAEAIVIRHTGLRRDMKNEQQLRDMIEKFRVGGTLNDKELRFLLQYYGIMVRMCEMSGVYYSLVRENAMLNYNTLLGMAKDRGWTQSLINMYGSIIESVFERIL